MIGFFDSGLGGLTVLKEVVIKLPRYSYLYLGDNARAPYGPRGQETIYHFTKQGVEALFDMGAELVVLACNSASANALRRLQREWLPERYPDRRILGIIVPTAEEIGAMTDTNVVGIMATTSTVRSNAYITEVAKRAPYVRVFQQACPLLVPIIEAGEAGWEGADLAVRKYVDALLAQNGNIDTIVLGCTHYPLVEDHIRNAVPGHVRVVSQGGIVAEKLADYLERHTEIETRLAKEGERRFYTTEESDAVGHLARMFWGSDISMTTIRLPEHE